MPRPRKCNRNFLGSLMTTYDAIIIRLMHNDSRKVSDRISVAALIGRQLRPEK